jgi:cyclase
MRVIARLDVKNDHVIKGIHLEGLRKVGDPNALALRYFQEGIDEILFMDAVASLYDRNNLFDVIARACEEVFIPITIGGGLRSLDDVAKALGAGADKVSINTAAVRNPGLVEQIATKYGSQCLVASIEAKRVGKSWEAYVDNGREPTGLDVLGWAQELERRGAGELLVTSVDKEGTKQGVDLELMRAVSDAVRMPIIASGGVGKLGHVEALCDRVPVSAIACASVLHYALLPIGELKAAIRGRGVEVRP